MIFPKSSRRLAVNATASLIVLLASSTAGADNLSKAVRLGDRLGGVRLAADDPFTQQIVSLIASGQAEAAANLLTGQDSFINVTAAHMFCPMSNRAETPIVLQPTGNFGCLNDFVATGLGIVRDNTDARELLTGNYTYQAAPGLTGVVYASDDLYRSNRHYAQYERNAHNYAQTLTKVAPQMVFNAAGAATPVPNTDAAGLLTTRTWAEAHLVAGTNRRGVEFAAKEFLCTELKDIGDQNLPDDMTARDVDRAPGGSTTTYKTTCSHCHNIHDPWHYAFAYWDWRADNGGYALFQPGTVQTKLNINANMYPSGYVARDDYWENRATQNSNTSLGWRTATTGNGIAAFGRMLANSRAFSACMVKKVFNEVCRRPVNIVNETAQVNSLADDFEANGYNIRRLFNKTAVLPQCIGE
jgi:hypothetical protein